MSDDFGKPLTVIQNMEKKILGNWAALQRMGRDRAAGKINWPLPDDDLHATAILEYKISMWQALLPAVWHIMDYQGDPAFSE